MVTRYLRLGGVAVLLSASLCLAQAGPGGPGGRPEGGRPRGGGPGGALGRLPLAGDWKPQLDRLATDLKLDDTQKAEAEKVFKAHEDKMRELTEQFKQPPEEMAKMQEIRKALREADEAGNTAESQKLREEMRGIQEARRVRLQPVMEKVDAAQKEQHDGLVALLHPEQKEKFEQIWQEWEEARRPNFMQRSPQALKRIVDRITDLSDDQKKKIDGLFDEFKKTTRETKEDSPEYKKLVEKLYTDVMAVLTPQQQEKASAALRGHGPGGDRGPGGEGGRGGPGGRQHGGPRPGGPAPGGPGGEKPGGGKG